MFIDNAAALALFHPEKMGKTDLVRGEHLFAGLNCFEPGQSHAPHSHPGQDKLYVVLEGSGEVQIGAETRIEEWSANNAESVMCDLQDVELING